MNINPDRISQDFNHYSNPENKPENKFVQIIKRVFNSIKEAFLYIGKKLHIVKVNSPTQADKKILKIVNNSNFSNKDLNLKRKEKEDEANPPASKTYMPLNTPLPPADAQEEKFFSVGTESENEIDSGSEAEEIEENSEHHSQQEITISKEEIDNFVNSIPSSPIQQTAVPSSKKTADIKIEELSFDEKKEQVSSEETADSLANEEMPSDPEKAIEVFFDENKKLTMEELSDLLENKELFLVELIGILHIFNATYKISPEPEDKTFVDQALKNIKINNKNYWKLKEFCNREAFLYLFYRELGFDATDLHKLALKVISSAQRV